MLMLLVVLCSVSSSPSPDDRTQAVLGRVSDTASLGAAFRALYSHELRHAYELSAEAAGSPMPEEEDGALQSPSGMASPLSPPSSQLQPRHIVTGVLAKPNDEAHRAYTDMLEEYERKQQIVVDALNQPKEPAQ
jgi:hypothetical protein